MLRPATAGDFAAIGVPLPHRIKGLCGVDEEGRVLGTGGVAFLQDGRRMAFVNLTPGAAAYKVTLHKAALRALREAREAGIKELIATADMAASEAAERWLSRLGFKPEANGAETVWIWRQP